MKSLFFLCLSLGCLGLVSCQKSLSKGDNRTALLVEEGRRLVEEVALCIDCHSPRLADGSFDQTKWLSGSPLGFQPLMEMPWAPAAPSLRGFLGYSEDEAIAFLTEGKRRGDLPPVLPPMPSYRLSNEEARAVFHYLTSLPAIEP